MPDTTTQDQQKDAMMAAPPARRSAWSAKQKAIRLLWGTIGRLAWCVPAFRPRTLRIFGGTVGQRCTFARSVEITIPWNICIGDDVQVCERAILYSLGTITIGSGTVIDVRAHLCAGSHDMHDTRFPLTRPPITIGRNCFIGIDTYIAPDVELGDGCRIHHRASVYKSCPADSELAGNPAKPVETGS